MSKVKFSTTIDTSNQGENKRSKNHWEIADRIFKQQEWGIENEWDNQFKRGIGNNAVRFCDSKHNNQPGAIYSHSMHSDKHEQN